MCAANHIAAMSVCATAARMMFSICSCRDARVALSFLIAVTALGWGEAFAGQCLWSTPLVNASQLLLQFRMLYRSLKS